MNPMHMAIILQTVLTIELTRNAYALFHVRTLWTHCVVNMYRFLSCLANTCDLHIMLHPADELDAVFCKYPHLWEALDTSLIPAAILAKIEGGRHRDPHTSLKARAGPQPFIHSQIKHLWDFSTIGYSLCRQKNKKLFYKGRFGGGNLLSNPHKWEMRNEMWKKHEWWFWIGKWEFPFLRRIIGFENRWILSPMSMVLNFYLSSRAGRSCACRGEAMWYSGHIRSTNVW
jgi:hypothetical protein